MPDLPDRPLWTTLLCDSLEKIFPDQRPRELNTAIPTTAFQGETVSFQIAFLPPTTGNELLTDRVIVDASTSSPASVTVSAVRLVPAEFVAFEGHDAGYLRDQPGLYPDLLEPLGEGSELVPVAGQWRAAWIDVTIPGDSTEPELDVTVKVRTSDGVHIGEYRLPVTVIPQSLPPLDIVNTHWFHCDGLAQYYNVDVFSDEHWAIIDNFLASAAGMDVNSVLTPAWTPPIDTAVGGLRTPTQLVSITDAGNCTFHFDFTMLERWMSLCRSHGITRLEMPHLFTQWGALATPAIYVMEGGRVERRFGWDVPATDPSYRALLEQLIPALRSVLDTHWGLSQVIFHISDEPNGDMAESYAAARAVVADLLEGCVIVDALSHFELHASGLVPIPVVATDAAQPFLDAQVEPLWLYYCVAQHRDVSNRFFSMPSSRNRVIGTQLYLTKAAGFLHWGFNFYNSVGSTRPLNPFLDTSAGGAFLAGDSFIVYPGPDGVALPSIRYRVFTEAMTDHRAMQLLRELAGDAEVRAIVDPDEDVTLTHFSLDPDRYRRGRASVTSRISELLVPMQSRR